jgi:predicted Zn-dependent peptidase
LQIDPEVLCEEASGGCFNVGVESFEVDSVPVIYKRTPGQPMVAMELDFQTGETTGAQQWTEALALQMANIGGSLQFGRVGWPKRLARLGAGMAAGAGVDYSSIGAVAPLPNWREMWDLLKQTVERPYLEGPLLDALKLDIARGFEAEGDDPERAAATAAFTLLFDGQRPNLLRESRAEVDRIVLDTIRRGWSSLRDEQRWFVTLVGDVARTDVERVVQEMVAIARADQRVAAALEPAQAATPAELEGAAGRGIGGPRDVLLLDYPASPAWHIVSYFLGPPGGASDYAALNLALRVLDRRLFTEVRDIRGLTYATGAGLNFSRQTYGEFRLLTDRPLEALPVVRNLVADLRTNGPTERELRTARALLREAILESGSTVGGQASLLAAWGLVGGGTQALDELLDSLDSVGASDVIVALSYLDGAKTAAAGPGDELTAAELSGLFAAP